MILNEADNIMPIYNPYPPRFRSYDDAMLYMKCFAMGLQFPKEKWVDAFEIVDGCSVMTEDYKNAPYELGAYEPKTNQNPTSSSGALSA